MTTEPEPGILVGGCRLGREIGRGGTGTVYRATQLGMDRAVAVKLIPAGADGLQTGARFEREARAAGALDHPHCLPVYAAGEEDGLLYLVMRLVDGPDLARLVRRDGPLPPARAVALIEQVASAVDYAHRAGLVHRDLKPANILIEPGGGAGHAWVSDFGLMRGITDSAITLTGQWVGTPEFAAPEQQRGEAVGPGADIYALGGVLSYALGASVPPALAAVLTRATAPDPAERYPTAGALAAAARSALEPSGAVGPVHHKAPLARTPRRRGSRRMALLGAAAVLLPAAAAAVVIVLLTRPHSHIGSPTPLGSTRSASATIPPDASAHRLITPAFTARLPVGWVATATESQMNGFRRTVLQSPTASTVVLIDRSLTSGQSLTAHAASVEAGAARTPGYRLISTATTRLGGSTAIVWSFSLSGQANGERVDVFRITGADLFAVLGTSDSLAQSERAATQIAAHITTP